MTTTRVSVKELIMVPAVITLLVTLLRLLGELKEWSPLFFGRQPGGGFAVIGIAWLVPIFGLYFGWKLARSGQVSVGAGRTIGFALLAAAVSIVVGFLASLVIAPDSMWSLLLLIVLAVAAIMITRMGWPELFSTLLAYGLAARIPVVVVMFFAIVGDWGTHYDAPPPDFPEMNWLLEWIVTGLVPQLTVWIAYTAIVGCVFGGIALALAGRGSSVAEAP